ncbi:MAG: glycosyltransferase family 4 protein [Anaerolineales bacterium]|jgi:glycosyltransferase involved in cell wall biosynthesis
MRIIYIADGRSPTARNWVTHFITPGNQVHLISTSDCTLIPGLASFHVLPVAFSGTGANATESGGVTGRLSTLRRMAPMGMRTFIRQWLGPLTLPAAVRRLNVLVEEIQPDLVHAMRYPFEGIMAAQAQPDAPLIVSVWGNDFTLHARSSPLIGWHTRRALARTDALHTDCQRDLHLARQLGFPGGKPAVVLPGAGGVRTEIFFPPEEPRPPHPPVIINPRGFRTYIRNDTFFHAVPAVLAEHPAARFLCPAMAHEPQAKKWVEELQLQESVELMPRIPHGQMADLYRRAHLVVSPSTHDGTPNTLLEALACGCFPVAGDIESIREWFTSGENALLVNPADPRALADAILHALDDRPLRVAARQANLELIAARADYQTVMAQVEEFYAEVAGG